MPYESLNYGVTNYGEIVHGGYYVSPDDIKQEQELRKKRKEYFDRVKRRENLRGDFKELLGDFYFVHYRKLLPLISDDTALAFRYLYLCTFADNEGKLIFDGKDVIHKDFKRLLRLKDLATASKVVSDLEKYSLIYQVNNIYYINLDYYIRNQKLPEDFRKNSSRMIDRGIKSLYEQSTPRYHEMLGKIVPLLEYINKNNNILCTKDTVNEYDYKKIKPLNAKEICEICGRSPENSGRFMKQLREFIINRLPFIRRIVDNTKYNLDCYIINPYVVYMGSYDEHLEWTFKLFDLRRR